MTVYYVTPKTYGTRDLGYLMPLDPDFEIGRAYVVSGVPDGVSRGSHAHRRQSQVFYCLRGRVVITCEEQPNTPVFWDVLAGKALYVGPMVWHWLAYYDDAIVLALGDEPYDEAEYIRDRDEWEALCSQR